MSVVYAQENVVTEMFPHPNGQIKMSRDRNCQTEKSRTH